MSVLKEFDWPLFADFHILADNTLYSDALSNAEYLRTPESYEFIIITNIKPWLPLEDYCKHVIDPESL
jgi:hypothetical protein